MIAARAKFPFESVPELLRAAQFFDASPLARRTGLREGRGGGVDVSRPVQPGLELLGVDRFGIRAHSHFTGDMCRSPADYRPCIPSLVGAPKRADRCISHPCMGKDSRLMVADNMDQRLRTWAAGTQPAGDGN